MTVAVMLFTRDLRVHDNPALAAAARAADQVVPLFVVDEAIRRSDFSAPNRARFLSESLADLDASLRDLGAGLVVRSGDVVRETVRVAEEVDASSVHLSSDVSPYAQRREESLRRTLGERELVTHPGVLVHEPGEVAPGGGDKDAFAVFTPYFRKWAATPLRDPGRKPRQLSMPAGVARGSLPAPEDFCKGDTSPGLMAGGETEGRRRASAWLRGPVDAYEDRHDDMARDDTSRLSPYLHFGCVSATELVARAGTSAGAKAFVRQICWRDFHHQVLASRPDAVSKDYRPRGDRWRRSAKDLAAWQEGRTGFPVVDAGMRQLTAEGWLHNRARLIVGNFLVRDLYLDWRLGARHFFDLLIDGDMANNTMNWQWVAGTGTDTRPNRGFNPIVQGKRYDPDGGYVRRWVPELASISGAAVHEPWKLPEQERRALDYPAPMVDHAEAFARFREAREAGKR